MQSSPSDSTKTPSVVFLLFGYLSSVVPVLLSVFVFWCFFYLILEPFDCVAIFCGSRALDRTPD